jgi:2-polyprenyl-3-methyl-5-hydroxy-6-metoxy-1,4-benzoquinol methylase
MNYTDKDLQKGELEFWVRSFNPPLFHEKWYGEFFNFPELDGKKVMEVGCGGYPISEYDANRDINMDLTLIDPLINQLINTEKFKHLNRHSSFSGSILEFEPRSDFDYTVCLNVIDHFNDPDLKYIEIFANSLKEGGQLWLYYDVRTENSDEHLALNHDKIIEKLNTYFTIENIQESINPHHIGWSKIINSVRLIAKKK